MRPRRLKGLICSVVLTGIVAIRSSSLSVAEVPADPDLCDLYTSQDC